ncbi:MAG: PilZ domain-containing protein [Proteobacteria bacterium]|nr:PilZ domain-containing protein [Pseudomonadota bacterium]
MFFKGKERRLNKRHVVCWDALLEVRFPDFQDQIQVKVVNFSIGGALLHSEQLSVDNRHLVVSDIKPELKLKIFLPETILESRAEIEWYNVREKNAFEIGIKFINFIEETRISVDELMKIIEGSK